MASHKMSQKVFLAREQEVVDITKVPRFYFDNKWSLEWSRDKGMYITMPPREAPPEPPKDKPKDK
jgi:hypothetical protein